MGGKLGKSRYILERRFGEANRSLREKATPAIVQQVERIQEHPSPGSLNRVEANTVVENGQDDDGFRGGRLGVPPVANAQYRESVIPVDSQPGKP